MTISKNVLLEAARHGREDIKQRIEQTLKEINRLEGELKFFKLKLNDYTTVIEQFSKEIDDDKIRHDN